jgi:hypothetical protein
LISFRYHLVTIVAVFLALGLGLLAGTTVVKPGLVDQLRKRTDQLEAQYQTAEQKRIEAQAQLSEIIPFVIAGKLQGTSVVLVTDEATDGAAVSEAQSSLEAAGADLLATLPVTSRMTLSDPGERHDLARIVGLPQSTGPGLLQHQAAVDLARRVVTAGRNTGTGADLLGELVSQGFIRKGELTDATLKEIGTRPGQIVIAITGGASAMDLPADEFMMPFVEQVAGRRPLAAAQPTDSADPFVASIRSNDALPTDRMITVDDLDQPIGGAALVLGLEQLLRQPVNGGGSYGIDGTSLIPAPAATTPAPAPAP